MKLAITLAAVAALAMPVSAAAAPSAKFLGDAIKGDNSETALGALAARRGRGAEVRSYGATLNRDHRRAKVDAVAAARREHVAIPRAMMPEARAEYAKLQHLSGRAFDREFARYMIDDHRKDIAEFEDQARTGDRITAQVARKTLPALRKHLAIARSIKA